MFNAKPSYTKRLPKRGFPAYVIFLCVITALYLAIEVPFATYLVDVLGGNPTPDAVHRLEHVGRVVSGFALALAWWSFQVPRALSAGKALWRVVLGCFLSALLLMPSIYFGEKALVDHIAATATPSDKQQAARVVAARQALFHPQAMEGIADTSEHRGGSWNAFRSLFAFLSFFDRDVLKRIPIGSDAVEIAIARSLPSASEFRTDFLPSLIGSYEDRFEPYRAISDAQNEALGVMYRRIDKAWADHMAFYKRVGATRSRQEVIRRGVDVPANWSPTDKQTFVRAIATEQIAPIDKQYQLGIDRLFGANAEVSPAKSTPLDYLSSAQIQALMAKDLGLTARPPFDIDRGMTLANELRLYALYRAEFISALRAAYEGDPSQFSSGERFGKLGEDSMRSVVAPVLALLLSIVGAFGHIFKLANYCFILILFLRQSKIGITRLLRDTGLIRVPLLASAAIYAAMTAYSPAKEITQTKLFQRSVVAWSERTGETVPKGVEWTISIQPWITPLSEALRATGLFQPIEHYLAGSSAPREAPAFSSVWETPHLEARYATVNIEGIEATIQLPLPRPNR